MSKRGPLNPSEIGALVALVNMNRLSDAERGVRTALEAHPDAAMLWKILSVALVRQGKDALGPLRRTAELMPEDAEAHRNLGSALHDQGQWEAALASLQRALALEPNDADALVDAADALRGLRRAHEALPLYHSALRLDPRMVEARNNLGNGYLELRSYADAARCYRLALDIAPDNVQILCNLANAERLLKRLDAATSVIQRALALDPGASVAHNNLGLILAAGGQRAAAVASFRQALVLDTGYVEALNNLGNVLRDLGARREALALYSRAVELDPAQPEALCNLGTVLFELRHVDEAIANYRRALTLRPEYAPAHLNLGLALRQKRRPAEAEACCQAALAIDPQYVEALSFLGELRADQGCFAEADELLRRATTLDPDFAFGYTSIPIYRKMTREDTEWRSGAEALLAKKPPLRHAIALHYALGKYFDDICHYDDAFGHFRQANDMTLRYGARYDRAKLSQRVAALIKSFDAAALRQHHSDASSSELPVFIVGMPRSGTSLSEQILASHPAVFGAGEVTFWNAAYDTYRSREIAGTVDTKLVPALAGSYLPLLQSLSSAQRVIDKLPANFLHLGLIHAAFPQARIIHMRRHPIDTCLSIYFQNFFNIGPYANDLDDMTLYYREYLRIMDHWRAVLPATALLEVPYEALIDDQEGWSRRMVDFIGLPWDPVCLDFHQTERVVITASKWQVRQKIHSASAGRWRHYEKFVGPLRGLLESWT